MGPGRLLSIIFAVGTVYGGKESLEIIPSNGEVQLGEKAIFLCKVRGSVEPNLLVWVDPEGEEISADSDKPYKEKHIDEVSKELEMILTDPSSGGLFQCKGEFDSGETVTVPIKIHVVQRPTIGKMDPEKEVTEGSTVNFNCRVTGIPPPTVRWLFGNQDLSLLGNDRIIVDSGLLLIENAQPSDAGIYSCEASTEDRREVAFSNVTLHIKFTPRIELLPEMLGVPQIGSPTQFNFTVLANPIPSVSISWKGKVFEGNEIVKVAQDQNRYVYSFEFTPASQEDIANFSITAMNEIGATVRELPFKQEPPEKGLGIGSLLAIVLAILLVVLLVVDACCYYKRRRGLLMYCRTNVLQKDPPGAMSENNQRARHKPVCYQIDHYKERNTCGIDTPTLKKQELRSEETGKAEKPHNSYSHLLASRSARN